MMPNDKQTQNAESSITDSPLPRRVCQPLLNGSLTCEQHIGWYGLGLGLLHDNYVPVRRTSSFGTEECCLRTNKRKTLSIVTREDGKCRGK